MSEHSHGHEEHEEHVLPIAVYLKVYGGLLVLTYLTVQVSFWALGSLSLPAAMAVAIVKAGLVVGFFMHLRYDTRFHSLVFFGSVLFLVIFATFTLFDLTTRGSIIDEQGTFAYQEYRELDEEARRAEEIAAMPPEERPQAEPEAEEHDEGGGSHKPGTAKDPARGASP